MSTATLLAHPALLEEARHHHAQGNLLQAAESYRQTLQSDPNSHHALLGLSLIARQSNQLEPALHMAEAALAAAPQSALTWANLGDALNALHQVPSAKAAFHQALALQPSLAAAHYGLGNALAIEDNFAAALNHFSFAARQTPTSPECHFAQAFAHGKLGEHIQAIAVYRRAVQLRPGFASAWLNLGVELVADGRDQLAEPCYHQTITASQNEHPASVNTCISAHLNLGHLHRGRRQFAPAQQHYESAFALAVANSGRLAEIHIAFAYLHLEQQQFPQAWQALRQAEAADPAHQNAEIPNARGILLLAEHTAQINPAPYLPLIEEAIEAFREAEALGHKTAASNRGNALLRMGRCTEAEAAHQAALQRDPHHPGVRYNLALTQLRQGDFAQGWPNYEIRWQFREVHPRPRIFPQPRWQGERLVCSASLLIYSEQGLGDTIQFLRYLRLVAVRSPDTHIVFEAQPPLLRLLTAYLISLQSMFPGITTEILPHGQPLPPFTHHVPLLSLPAIFQTALETVPGQIPYLQADPQLTRQCAAELSNYGNDSPLKIGLNWVGNPNYRADHERSTTLQTFLQLLEIPGIHWISLQKGSAVQQIAQFRPHLHLCNASDHDRDLADTAALIANLDLVITTDTAIAHLAGALGKPLWLLLPWQSDWRWMQGRLTTPWYPQARLFRQSSPHNWPELIDRVARQLRTHLESPGAPPSAQLFALKVGSDPAQPAL
jgi:tetratricopeptide (TPR) repeat protein